MKRTLSFRAVDDDKLLLEEPTLAFRVHAGCERDAAVLAVAAGTLVRITLLDDEGHLLDSLSYEVPAAEGKHSARQSTTAGH